MKLVVIIDIIRQLSLLDLLLDNLKRTINILAIRSIAVIAVLFLLILILDWAILVC